jgi:phospholipid/cholesterol/gamma-HCH transport system substrate-binding protein
MGSLLKDHRLEALAGLLVVALATWFLLFAWQRDRSEGRYALTARFPNVSGVSVGTDVRLSGMKVGTVSGQMLDPATFQAVLTLSVDAAIKLPLDSSAAITSDGLLGGAHVVLVPGGDPAHLQAGDEITDTQGATDLMGLIGSVINRSGGEAPPPEAAPAE